MSEPFELVRDKLASAGAKFSDTRQSHFMATCPVHEDKNPSLSVDWKEDRVLMHCHAHCQPDDILAALDLEFSDLFEGEADLDRAVPVRSYVYKLSNGQPWIIVDRYYPKTFKQRLPGTAPGDRGGLKGREPILYRADRLWQCMQAGPCTVWLVEGEKDVETAERHGLMATTAMMGAGKWRDKYTQFLRHAAEVVIVADQDVMKADGTLGSGQQHALAARAALKAAGVKVKVVAPAVGKDLTDHFVAGYTAEDFRPEPTAFTRPRGMDAATLMEHEFEPISWAVDKILPAGLTIFAGSPKAGKSWVSLDWCLAVACGGVALGGIPTTGGNTLYLAREDTYRRLQSRIALLTGGAMDAPKALELMPQEQDWPGGEEGLANLTEWAEECGDPRLVVIDTLQKVEPDMGEDGRRGAYTGNYTMMSRYKVWADQHNCSVVMIHHDRKTQGKEDENEDPFRNISGTRGLTGAADTLMFLQTKRGTREGTLHVTGRDVVEQSLELFKVGPLWQAISLPE